MAIISYVSQADLVAAVQSQNAPVVNNQVLTGVRLSTTRQTLTGAGAVDLVSDTTDLVTTGANALTLLDGTDGQLKEITMLTDGGDGTLTPTTKTGYTTITFNDVGDSVLLRFRTTKGWMIRSNYGCTIA